MNRTRLCKNPKLVHTWNQYMLTHSHSVTVGKDLNHESASGPIHDSVPASEPIPQRVCTTAAKGCTKTDSHAVHHNVAHPPSKAADLV